MAFEFVKLSGAGNDFILTDNRRGTLKNLPALAKKLTDRKRSIGADGLIVMEKSRIADLKMRIFNSDGSEAEMCGNGVRCAAKFAVMKRMAGNRASIETLAGIIGTQVKGDLVRARMTDPKGLKLDMAVRLDGRDEKLHFVDTGVPHAISVHTSVDSVDVPNVGRAIRRHSAFAPRGTNANFVVIDAKKNEIAVRTYERGVEDETLACGTGSTAAALIAAELKGLRSPVTVHTHGGDVLKIYFSKDGGRFHDVYLEGAVKTSFEGRILS